MTLCVYALAGRVAPLRARGMTGERLQVIGSGGVTAIAGELRAIPTPAPATLRRYDAVVRRLAERQPALLPARFGTCFSDPYELSYILRARQASLRAALTWVRGRVQMTIRIVGAGGHDETPADARHHLPPSGTAYLRARAEHAARERHVPGFEPVRTAVRRWVRDERVEKRAGIASVYHLVPRASAAAYVAALEHAAAVAGVKLVVTGPWPPYAFADDALFK